VHVGYNYNFQGDKGFYSILAGNFKTGRIEEEGGEEAGKFEVIKSQSQDKQYSDSPHDGIAFIGETVLIPVDTLEIRRTARSVCEYPENALFSLEFA